MKNFIYLFPFVIISGFAVFQISNIFLFGSIFENLRKLIKRKSRQGGQMAKLMKDLFKCDLCMSTQVSIWFVGVPLCFIISTNLHLLDFIQSYKTIFIIFIIVILIFSISTTSYFLFRFKDYLRWNSSSKKRKR
jgi:hypothetical protein